MQAKGQAKHFILAFLLALAGYAACYIGIEHWRARKGPWRVTFTHSAAREPVLQINQPGLGIVNVQIVLALENPGATNAPGAASSQPAAPTTLLFGQPRPVPYPVPFGQCVFLDLSSLPGTATFELLGHEVQLLPRVLIVDGQEHAWQPNARLTLRPALAASPRAQPGPQ